MIELFVFKKSSILEPWVVVHMCNPTSWGTEAGRTVLSSWSG